MLGEFCEWDAGDFDGDSVGGFGVRGLERGLQRNRDLRGDGDGGDFGDGDVQQFEYRGDDHDSERRVDHRDDYTGRDNLLWIDHYLRAGTDRDGDFNGDIFFAVDQREFYSEYDRVSGRVGAGGAAADFLPGNYGDADGVAAGWVWFRRRDWDDADGANDGRDGVCIPQVAASGIDVCFAGFGGVRDGVLRRFAEESDGAGHAAGDLFYFAHGDFEWADDHAAEFSDAGGEVGFSFGDVCFLRGAGILFPALFFGVLAWREVLRLAAGQEGDPSSLRSSG